MHHSAPQPALRILHVIEPTFAGVRRHVVDLIVGIAASEGSDVEQHLAYSMLRADGEFMATLPKFAKAGVGLLEVPLARSIDPKGDARAVLELRRYVKDHNIDLVHCHSSKAGIVGRVAAKSTRRRSIYTPNASPFRISRAFRAIEMTAARLLTDAVIAVSSSERDELVEHRIVPHSSIHVVSSGIGEAESSEAPADWPLHDDSRLVIGTVGRIVQQKSPELMVEIAAAVIRQRPDVRFVWVGDGELRADVERWVRSRGLSDRFVVTGWVDSIDAVYPMFDIFVLPSQYESFGYVTVEAMRASLPCVVSNVPGSIDVVDDQVTGAIVELGGGPEAFATEIVRLIDEPALRMKWGLAGQQRWSNQFRLESMAAGTMSVYRCVASRGR